MRLARALSLSVLVAACASRRLGPATVATPDAPFRYQPPALAPMHAPQITGVREARLSNGLRVIVASLPDTASVNMQFVNRRGGDDTEPDRPGLAAFTARVVAASLVRCDAPSQDACANGPARYLVDHQSARFYGDVEPGEVGTFALRVASGLRHGWVPRDEFFRILNLSISDARQAGGHSLGSYVAPRMFDDGTLFHSRLAVSPRELGLLRYEAATALYRQRYTPGECALIAVGRTTLDEVLPYAERLLAPWQGAAASAPSDGRAVLREGGDRMMLLETGSLPQAEVMFSVPLRVDGPRALAAIELAGSTLASSFSSRIQRALRVERGSAYSVNASVSRFGDVAVLTIESVIENERVAESLRIIRDAFASVGRDGLTEAEFQAATHASLSRWETLLDSPEGIASTLLDAVVERRAADAPPAWVGALPTISRDEVNRYLHTEIDLERARVFVRGDASALREGLERAGFGRVATPAHE